MSTNFVVLLLGLQPAPGAKRAARIAEDPGLKRGDEEVLA
jgi:hypothetical protein